MTWMSTWPSNGIPTYRVHATEQEAAAYSKWLIDSETTRTAVYFELALPDERPHP